MVAPGGSQSFAVIIDMLLKGDQDVTKKLDAIASESQKAGKTLQDLTLQQHEAVVKLAQAEEQRTKDFIKNIRARSREISVEVALLKDSAADIDRFAKPLQALGAITVGGIFAFASKYVKDAKTATTTTIEWKAAQESLNKSGAKIGEVLATTALPLLKEAAVVTEKIAGFLERNPGTVEFALKAGLVSLAVGTLGRAVASGIRLYADLKFDAVLALNYQATQLNTKALAANTLSQGGSLPGGISTKGGGIAAALASPLAIGAIAVGTILGAVKTVNEFDKLKESLTTAGGAAETLNNPLVKMIQFFVNLTNPLLKNVDVFQKLKEKLDALNGQVSPSSGSAGVPSFLGGSPEVQNQIVDAYGKYKDADIALVKDHYAERQGIVADALKQTQAENASYSNNSAKITAQAGKALAGAQADFQKDAARAETAYYSERTKIAADGAVEIIDLQKESQERLQKIRENFEDKAASATSRRDAFALADARKDFDKQRAEEISNTKEGIAKRRQDIALRLQELDTQFRQEQARRLEDYQARVAEIRAQAVEQHKEAAVTHAAELKRIETEKQDKLRQADEALFAERKKRYTAIIAQLGDLDASLKIERNMKTGYYNAMLVDATTFITAYKRTLALSSTSSSSTPIGIHDFTGYAEKGIYQMAQSGGREFVLSGADTRAAEKIVGAQLNQSNIMQAMLGGGGKSQVTWNDSRRFDGDVSDATRRAVRRDTEQILGRLFA